MFNSFRTIQNSDSIYQNIKLSIYLFFYINPLNTKKTLVFYTHFNIAFVLVLFCFLFVWLKIAKNFDTSIGSFNSWHIFADNFFHHIGIVNRCANSTVFVDIIANIHLYKANFSMYIIHIDYRSRANFIS